MNKGTAIVGFILSFVAGMMLMWGLNQNGGLGGDEKITADENGASTDSPIPVLADDPVWGSATAPVTLVLFSDYQCPFCGRVEATIEKLKKEYGKKKLRVVWKENPLPFHKSARPASVASATVRALAGNDAFWKFHAKAFANQKALTRENFEKWAKEVGVDMKKFKAALDKNTYGAKVDKDLALGKKLGVRGTPHSIVNGVSVNGAQPYPKFKEVVDAQLKAAQAMIKAGTKPSNVYAAACKKNWKQKPAKAKDKKKRKEPTEDKTVWKVPVGKSPVRGAKDALVTLVMFSEFQCPFCKRVEPTIDQLLKDYDGKLRIVWKNRPLPFHKKAEPACLFAVEAYKQKGEKGFWAAHNMLFENQPKFDESNFEDYAKKLGLNWPAMKNAIEKKTGAPSIQADMALADSLKANGTPHMFINGRRIVGAQPIAKFKKLIDEELKKAEALVKKGTPKAKVYETIMKTAKTPPPPPPPEKKDVPAPTAENPYRGGKNAKIVIQLISDFQCPFCGRVEPTFSALLEKYGDKIKVVWRQNPLPFHKNAKLAAEASVEVFKQKGNDGFWKFHDILFKNQKALLRPDLEKYAEQVGCDMAKFKAALDNHTHAKFIEQEIEVAKKAGIRGTPASVINGYFLSGAQPIAQFEKVIKLAMADLKKKKK